MIARGRFSADKHASFGKLLPILQLKVSINDVENIHQLALILMDSFHLKSYKALLNYLDVKKGLLVYFFSAIGFNPLAKSLFVLKLHVVPFLLESLFVNEIL